MEDMQTIWARPSFVLATAAVGVRDGGELVGYGGMAWARYADVWVAPSHRGRGLGTALMRWSWDTARVLGYQSVGQSVHEHAADALALLGGAGYEHSRTSWILAIAFDAAPAAARGPGGLHAAQLPPDEDDRAAHRVIDEAFGEWEDRSGTSYEDWVADTLRRPGFVAEQLLPRGPRRAMSSARWCSWTTRTRRYVDQLAVARPAPRPRTGAGAAPARLRRRLGARRAHVRRWRTDSRTGALGLYEHVGMHPRGTYLHLERRAAVSARAREAARAARADGARRAQPLHGRAADRDLGRLAGPGRRGRPDDDGGAGRDRRDGADLLRRSWRRSAGWAPRTTRWPAARPTGAASRGCARSTRRPRRSRRRVAARPRQGPRRGGRRRRAGVRDLVPLLRRLLDRAEPKARGDRRRLWRRVPERVVHPGLLGGWWLSKPQPTRRTPDEVAR